MVRVRDQSPEDDEPDEPDEPDPPELGLGAGAVAGAGAGAAEGAAGAGAGAAGALPPSPAAAGSLAAPPLLPSRKSVTYQPEPFNWKPAAVSCLANVDSPQFGHTVSGGSDSFCRASLAKPQEVHL